jgi:hypothetical protein
VRVGIAQSYAFEGLGEEVLTALNGAKDALAALGARWRNGFGLRFSLTLTK